MIFRQLTHDDLGCASYLVGDEHAGVAAVVDPKLDIEDYLRLARYVVDGGVPLWKRRGWPIEVPQAAEA